MVARLTVFGLLTRFNQMACRMTKFTKLSIEMSISDFNIEISILSREICGIMVVGLEKTHQTLRGSQLEAQAHRTKNANHKEMIEVGDMDH
jgi:hypothetical protein